MSQFDYDLYYERNLPHYQPPGGTFFITFRLAGSLPKEIMERLSAEADCQIGELKINPGSLDYTDKLRKLQKILFSRWDTELDKNKNGPMYLEKPEIAEIVKNAIHFLDGKQYILDAFCIMPNHVHIVFTPLTAGGDYFSISKILHTLKRFTAREANIVLNRPGQFWQHESYDHVIRDDGELENIISYVLMNPIKAGLKPNWVYSRFQPDE